MKGYKTVGKCGWCDRYNREVWSIKDEVHDCIRYECTDSTSCNKRRRETIGMKDNILRRN